MLIWRSKWIRYCSLNFLQNCRRFTCCHVANKSPKVKDVHLLQGALGPPLELIQPKEKTLLPPLLKEVNLQQKKFADCILLTRVGNFYELYFDQAEELGPLLNLRVSKKKTSHYEVSMAGFPFFKLDRYLKILVEDLKRCVALSEEALRPADDFSSKNMYTRFVTRVITPGTLIDENFMDHFQSNYVMSIISQDSVNNANQNDNVSEGLNEKSSSLRIGLSWLDLSTGEFFSQTSDHQRLVGDLARIQPKEIVLDNRLQGVGSHPILESIDRSIYFVSYTPMQDWSFQQWSAYLEKEIEPTYIENCSIIEKRAGSVLLSYVSDRLLNSHTNLRAPIHVSLRDSMLIDASAMKGLEIRSSLQENRYTGSLLHAIKRSVTKSGSRLLTQRLCSPSTDISEINRRLDLVEVFIHRDQLRTEIRHLLKRSNDTHRILQRLLMRRGNAYDLLGLSNNFSIIKNIESLLTKTSSKTLKPLLNALYQHDALASLISEALNESALVRKRTEEEKEAEDIAAQSTELSESESIVSGAKKRTSVPENGFKQNFSDIWIITPTFNETLQNLHKRIESLLLSYDKLQNTLDKKFESKATLRKNPSKLYYVHMKSSNSLLLKEFMSVFPKATVFHTTKATASIQLPEWSSLGLELESVKSFIHQEEARVLQIIIDTVLEEHKKIRETANILDELDISTSLADLAAECEFSRPILDDSLSNTIIQGRHPIVEKGLKNKLLQFTPNDCLVGNSGDNIWLLTGPNMAGKSTFLRQNAVISILAQMGSFVPASYAKIGIVDQIFSRIGSADNLYHQQSTFMVEMMETAFILKNATNRSFIIMDEVGRGTTARDGLAIAYGCLKYLSDVNRARTLFATHAHELAEKFKAYKNIKCYCTDIIVNENTDTFTFDYKIREGVNMRSHGLRVAEVAGLPKEVLVAANELLHQTTSP
ncbi:MutS protein 1 [Schizosaccharomyces cryophilus OY26]|uniref:MutS protein 1 n=1 Tax=Schizosaccharomyces cryophilus (strain OY26 / ATCC MYA-4695 / CBS 11777 / NBRC 106824 / NRRL Y48691) TaxID=653667 RepID=S9X3T7_SCHCR|nr:MutS protein 1 [Schizosaccharomyces cryophilus OY26]EPY51762.1 MutS protein 1 [Schizosaccharomyces cryophilus OY26]